MTLEINKSTIVKVIILVVVLIFAIIGYQIYQSYSKKATKKELVSNLSNAGYLSAIILSDYSETMNAAQRYYGGNILNENGEYESSSDPQWALEQRIKYYQNIGIRSHLDSLKDVMQKQMKKIDSHDEEDLAFVSAFENVSKLLNYATAPSGSPMTLALEVGMYYSNFNSCMDKLGVYYKVSPRDSVIKWNSDFITKRGESFLQKRRKKKN